jgi:hypothetical protein
MGGKTSTTTQQVQIPQEVLDRYNAVNAQAQSVAQTPFQIYSTDPSKFVAQLNQQQLTGIGNVNAAAGAYQPYIGEATDATRSGMAAAMPGQLEIDKYMNPYQQQVIDATMKQMAQANEQAQSGALGTAISSGAFGGDRAGIAAANLANQQGLSMGSTLAGLNAQNYSQALQTAQQQQGLNLGAEQANLARLLSGGQQMAGLGQMAQGLGLQGAEAQINAGTLGQQTEQAGLSALYNQFQQQQAYPFQVAQFLANIAMGTGALSGSTTTTTQPVSFFSDRRLKHDIKRIGKTDEGLPIYKFKYKGDDSEQTHIGFMADEVEKHHPEAVGLDPSGYKTVDYDRATKANGGGVAGPYGSMVGSQPGVGGYVPQAYLPVGELMVADSAGLDNAQRTFAQQMEAAANFGENMIELKDRFGKGGDFWELFQKNREGNSRGGVVGYASGGPAYLEGGLKPTENPVQKESYLSDTVNSQEDAKKNQIMQPGSAPGQPESTMSKIGTAANTALAVANLAAMFSDRRMKHDIKRIGKTDDGMPIYKFKYKGDDREQTHIGFMADEVERKHPDAVMTDPSGMKKVDYGQADKFYQGGVVRQGYRVGGGPEAEEEIIRRRLMSGDVPRPMNLGDLPNARVIPAAEVSPTPNRETIPAGDLTGLAAAAIARADAKPTPQPGLVPAAQPETRPAAVDPSEFYRTKIITQESGGRQFDSTGNPLTSSAGAIGIGQIMPDTAPEAARMAGLPWDEERYRNDPEYNAALGEAYFLNMYDRFGSLDLASAAYNAGPGRLSSALDRAAAMGGSYLDYLPEETQNYVASVTGAGSASRGVAGGMPTGDEYSNIVNMSSKGVAGGAGSQSGSEEYSGGLGLTPDKPYEERNALGKMFYNRDGTTNKDALLSILSGIGTMASSPSLYLGSAILQGIGGAANTYSGLEQQRGEITAKNLENANTFMRQYLRAQAMGYAGTPKEYASSILYSGPIPSEIGFTPTTGGPNVTSFMGVPLDPFGRGMTARTTISVDGKPVEVMAGQTYGYLDALRKKLVSDVEFGIATPETLQRVEEALANHRGQIVLADGSTVVDPTYEDAVFGASATVRDITRTDELGLSVSDAMLGAQNSLRSTEELAKALSMLPSTGDLAPTFAFIGRIGQQLGFDVPTNAVEGYDIAAKISAGFARDAVNSLAGKVDTNTLAALTQATTANSNMSPGAIEEILAIQSGIADYNLALSIAIYEAQLANQSANLAEVERDFIRNNNPETFIEKRRPEFKGTIQRPAEAAPEETDAATQELLRRGYTIDADGNLIPPGQQP